jgi:site-specific recombinase XerC
METSASTENGRRCINLYLSAIRRLADEAADSGWLSPELAIGIRRVKGVKRLGRRLGNWLSSDQAQDWLDSISTSTLCGKRDAAGIGLLLGCGLRRSEIVKLRVDQLQKRANANQLSQTIERNLACPMFCTSEIVSVAQR